MRREDFKEGVRVYWGGSADTAPDTGTIASSFGSVWDAYLSDSVYVQWDYDGRILHVPYYELEAEPPKAPSQELTEAQAVMFLLSKGYTVSKGK